MHTNEHEWKTKNDIDSKAIDNTFRLNFCDKTFSFFVIFRVNSWQNSKEDP